MAAPALFDEAALDQLRDPSWSRLVVALSGGVDSVALLHAVSSVVPDADIRALHINHQLQPAAVDFQDACDTLCRQLNLRLTTLQVNVQQGGSVETRAREARYAAFESFLQSGDLLLLAHHADDQAETVLFRLLRDGRLEGMPRQRPVGRATLFRPLLDRSRQDIVDYATANQLRWCEDPSNQALQHDRNLLRHQVLPLLAGYWPSVRQALVGAATAEQQVRQADQLARRAQIDHLRTSPDGLALAPLRRLAQAELVELLRAWLMDLALPLPTGRMLSDLAQVVIDAQRVSKTTGELSFQQWHDQLFVLRPLVAVSQPVIPLGEGEVPFAGGMVTNDHTELQGLCQRRDYRLAVRQGGEMIRMRHRRRLKQVLQESGVPVWLRDRVPLVWSGDELVAIAALPEWGLAMQIADGFAAAPGEGREVAFRAQDRLC